MNRRVKLCCSRLFCRDSFMRIMVSGSLTRENISTVSLDRVWKAGVLDAHNLIPKLLPDFIASGEIVEGDGGVGTVKKLTFTDAVKEFSFVKDRVEVMDHEKFIVKQAVIEGGLIGKRLKSYSYEMKFEVGSNGGTVGKIRLEYDTQDDTLLGAEEEEQMLEGLFMMIKAIEGYLLANPTAYV